MKASLSASPVALTIELPFAEVARGARPPQPLARAQAEHLANVIGRDLQRLLGDTLYDAGMVVVGALYDLPELLQPGLPAVDALTSVYADAMPPTGFEPSLLAIGGQGGRFPIPDIAPQRQPGAGPLLLLPLVLIAPPDTLDSITPVLEEKLLHTGQAGLDTTRAVQQGFGVAPENLTYATFNDLCALMKVQLDHGGFAPLWNLIENALFQRRDSQREALDSGNQFVWDGERVLTPFYTLTEWMARPPTGQDATVSAYLAWLRMQRQYLAGLEAHGVATQVVGPDATLERTCTDSAVGRTGGDLPDESLRVERSGPDRADQDEACTRLIAIEHGTPELGPVAFSAAEEMADGRLRNVEHCYPVRRPAIETVRRQLEQRARNLGVELALHRSEDILLEEDGTRLRARP